MSERVLFRWQALRLFALSLLAIKLVLLGFVHPFMDEAYYFIWGQHPALSYFDHPPMVAWTQGLSAALFGWNQFALRLPLALTTLGDLGLLYLFARRLAGDDWRDSFWLSAALFLATPVFFALTSVTLPDHLLIFFALASLYFLHGFFVSRESGTPAYRLLYLGAAALGFAMLTKYYGVLFGAGLVAFVVLGARTRGLLRSPHFWLAAALAIAMQAPVLKWNLDHDFASFRFIVEGRGGLENGLPLSGTLGYLLGIIAIVSPFLIWPMARFALARNTGAGRLAQTIFWGSTLAFLAASVFTNILVHWNLVAYVAMLPFLVPYLRSRLLLAGHFIYGTLAIAVLALNYGVMPLGALFDFTDQTSAWSHGWDEVAAEVQRIEADNPAAFVAATDYTLAGSLGFALRDKNVVSLSRRPDAYDFWFDAGAMRGRDALIVADRWRPLTDAVEGQFASVTQVDSVKITRFDRRIDTYKIYLAKGFSPPSQAEN